MDKISKANPTGSIARENLAELAKRRAQTYRTLSVACAMPADRSMLEVFRQWCERDSWLSAGELPGAVRRGLRSVRAWFEREGDKDPEVRLAELAVEFQRLFRGLDRGQSPPTPHESGY